MNPDSTKITPELPNRFVNIREFIKRLPLNEVRGLLERLSDRPDFYAGCAKQIRSDSMLQQLSKEIRKSEELEARLIHAIGKKDSAIFDLTIQLIHKWPEEEVTAVMEAIDAERKRDGS